MGVKWGERKRESTGLYRLPICHLLVVIIDVLYFIVGDRRKFPNIEGLY